MPNHCLFNECFLFSYCFAVVGLTSGIATVLGKLAMMTKKDIDKKALAKRNKEFARHLQRQNTNLVFVEPKITINEMGQNENAVGLAANNNSFWNKHLCGVNFYMMMALWFMPMLIIVSFQDGTDDFFIKGEMLNFFSSLSNLDKMLMKDSLFYFLINCIYPSMIYINKEKLRTHVRKEFF